ncbi:MAG: cupin domain-containing protein [Gammaproteobacteria bacterium]|nr:cupin domain-containing protein [Gammaproteobacteria bacterium]
MKSTLQKLNFTDINLDTFLRDYWQKKPVVLKQAMSDFASPLSAEELAGLSLEPEVESRIVVEQPNQTPPWIIRKGPFTDDEYTSLPKTHWTLLVQGVDRLLPEIQNLLDYFDFIPQWRVDDVMISYAALHGSVGPHYDNYDVFLLQAQGQRKWMLTTQNCHDKNIVSDVDLRIMNQFIIEQEYVLEPGDILYLPPHVGHHGVSLSDDCMTYSFGYRSYPGLEVINNFCDYLNELDSFKSLYKDTDWRTINHTSELPEAAWKNAKALIHTALDDDNILKNWFGQFATNLDQEAEMQLPSILDNVSEDDFAALLSSNKTLHRHPICKMAYQLDANQSAYKLYINGVTWKIDGVTLDLIEMVANYRTIECQHLNDFISLSVNMGFLFELWQLQWLQFSDEIL